MLGIYKNLFENLQGSGLRYSVFKSLEHLDADLAGERGDVDIWFDIKQRQQAIRLAQSCGFFNVSWSSWKGNACIMTGWDMTTGKRVLLHVHFRPIAVKKRSLIPLYFTYNSPPTPATKSIPPTPSTQWIEAFESNRKILKSKSDPVLIRWILTRSREIPQLGFRFSLLETIKMYTTYFHRFFVSRGRYRISRKGLLVAMVGIDGSGKSSMVKYLSGASFLQKSQGTRVVYFGNKDFWIPGLEWALAKDPSPKPIKILLVALSTIDIKLRAVPALWYLNRGFIVVCDRYYYDHLIGDPVGKFIRGNALKKLIMPFVIWIPVKPDITMYLQVDAKTAYGRKQDYALSKVKEMVTAYNDLLLNRPEVVAINANEPLEKVQQEARSVLQRHIKASYGK